MDTARDIVIERAGGVTALAKELGITTQAISQWEQVPAERVVAVARLTGLSPAVIRPDLYPPDLV